MYYILQLCVFCVCHRKYLIHKFEFVYSTYTDTHQGRSQRFKKGGAIPKKCICCFATLFKKCVCCLMTLLKKGVCCSRSEKFLKKGRKIHNFWATTKFFTYFWGSTKFLIQWWWFHVSKGGGDNCPISPVPPPQWAKIGYQGTLILKMILKLFF